jgi:N-acetylneuraminic acid mutarotase
LRALLGAVLGLWVALASACGLPRLPAGQRTGPPKPTTPAAPTRPAPVTAVAVTDLGPLLPRGLEGAAAAAFGGKVYVAGGSGSAGFSDAVYAFSPATGQVTVAGRLPAALHDAGAAATGDGVLVCGGGQSAGSSAVYHIRADGTVSRAGSMPRSLSDLVGVTVGGRAYCLGGWTGSLYSDAVYDVQAFSLAAHLPHAVRYPAAVPLAGGVLVAGGQRVGGAPTADLQWVPLGPGASGSPAVVGQLPTPVAYAMGATLAGTGLVIGGCPASGPPATAIWAVTAAGTAVPVGDLPQPLCYGAAAGAGDAVYVFGGKTAAGTASDHVWKIVRKP